MSESQYAFSRFFILNFTLLDLRQATALHILLNSRERERESGRQTDRQKETDRQPHRQTDRQTDRQTCAARTGAPFPLELDDTAGDASDEGAAEKEGAAASLPNIPARPVCAVAAAETWERADGELSSEQFIGGRDAREGLGGGLTE